MMIIPSHVAHPCYMVTGGPGLPLRWPIPPGRISPLSGHLIWPTQVHGLHSAHLAVVLPVRQTGRDCIYGTDIPWKKCFGSGGEVV